MATELQVTKKVVKISREEFPDELIYIVRKHDGSCTWCLAANYIGDEEKIVGRYLNGALAPA